MPFDPEDTDLGLVGSPPWNKHVFARAYCGNRPGGRPAVFQDVVDRLNAGYSVLAYVPGNCMSAAADVVKTDAWKEFGKHPGGEEGIADIWKAEAAGMFQKIHGWLGGGDATAPHAIYHNLDLMGDGHGGIHGNENALTAHFSLLEATRTGVVLGLADRDAGRLPEAIEKAFSDSVSIRQIDLEGFDEIIPVKLVDLLGQNGRIGAGAAWQLASRLRWSDPIRAVKLMMEAAENQRDLTGVLRAISEKTRPVGYSLLPIKDADEETRLAGFDNDTRDMIRQQVITPFRKLAAFEASDPEAYKKARKAMHAGVVLHGPAGTGKTTLARWIARTIGLPIKVASAAEIKDPLYGNAERKMQALFRDARRAAPCVLVLDDADDLFPLRDKVSGSVASADLGVVNAALQELDGFNGPLEDVLLILTTNRFSSMDQAISQRLGLHIRVPYPLENAQVELIVRTIAGEYQLGLAEEIRDQLVQHFMGWASDAHGPNNIMTPAGRRLCLEGLFSQRMIAKAMLHLRGEAAVMGQAYRPDQSDIDRMKNYFALQR